MHKLFSILINLISKISFQTLAQSGDSNAPVNSDVAMADALRADGKIYVVVAVLLIILVGLFAYLFRVERKIKKLESEELK
ncbi:CcmD family protein [Mangrovivirga sp. M17]|uniref:CcmD family protein n=1 Tax=Mangrovivirga halotolerans TaxID=2993936 RepID=A0ABT3RSY7_9BACT|nr:CcmD family protein [Mangrovivirga halotolerans]MCX2744606.1 CcmD family protein [Mangrovivirga halotolerans]